MRFSYTSNCYLEKFITLEEVIHFEIECKHMSHSILIGPRLDRPFLNWHIKITTLLNFKQSFELAAITWLQDSKFLNENLLKTPKRTVNLQSFSWIEFVDQSILRPNKFSHKLSLFVCVIQILPPPILYFKTFLLHTESGKC